MLEKDINKKIETLEEQYKKDCERRLNNTVKVLEKVAEENMEGQEKEEFLENLK